MNFSRDLQGLKTLDKTSKVFKTLEVFKPYQYVENIL